MNPRSTIPSGGWCFYLSRLAALPGVRRRGGPVA